MRHDETNDYIWRAIAIKIIFENDKFECFLVGNPRADGHTAISTKTH